MGGSPHYFIAILLPEELQEYFSIWQSVLREKLPYKQWYNKRDFHITLKFLGAVDNDKLQELDKKLQGIKMLNAFHVNVGSIGTFGNPKTPRVLWSGVEKTDTLSQLAQIVEEYAVQLGFSKENRAYTPHITLAKKWAGNQVTRYDEILSEMKNKYTTKEKMLVHEVILFQIHPNREQKYEIIRRYPLR
ncbi:RNA 2',3'-cyclic phosphodiesterase [Oceanobacillus bengalensis]|uniref:RNA 2',3'-cyclic phosphodiesterase n=2 Tax=Oceanobacillus bengalensis TaxID=1435466 RepID=A0A494YXV7_9BACI|nr:RNA 2',3'-cyclic phosphodiesterase [Oceanobacillus bengalensis]RKQ14534.1 RNA 2',3'-cyclic phosphodiesterase [Oceanobacillus bengalensis]